MTRKRLLKLSVREAQPDDAEAIVNIFNEKIFTYVRADNMPGLAPYLSQGFRIVGTAQRHAKFNGKYIDEVIIDRFL